jgi:hypothetical protein
MNSKTIWYLYQHMTDEWKCVSSGNLSDIKKAQNICIQNGVTSPLRVQHSKLIVSNG